MQAASFDIWGFFLSLLFFVQTCSVSSPSTSVLSFDETTPGATALADKGVDDYSSVKTKLTLVLLKDDRVFAYEGLDVDSGKMYTKSQIRPLVQAAKKKFSTPEFAVLIKLSKEATYDNAVNVLDEMTVNNISRYRVADLSPEEQKKIYKSGYR